MSQTDDAFHRQHPDLAPRFYGAIGKLARAPAPGIEAMTAAGATLVELRNEGASVLTVGQQLSITLVVAGFADPTQSTPTAHSSLPSGLPGVERTCRSMISAAPISLR